MSKFVTLSMILDTRMEPGMDEHSGADELPFLSWKVGHKVQSNGSDQRVWKIAGIFTAGSIATDSMSYSHKVQLQVDGDPAEEKFVGGATLQQGYHIVQQGEDDGVNEVVVPAIPTKPITISVDQVRNFYPRKNDKPGTRVVLKSGTAYVVLEDHAAVLTAIEGRSELPTLPAL